MGINAFWLNFHVWVTYPFNRQMWMTCIITFLVPIIGVTAVLNICLTLLAMCSVLHNCSFVFCALLDSTPAFSSWCCFFFLPRSQTISHILSPALAFRSIILYFSTVSLHSVRLQSLAVDRARAQGEMHSRLESTLQCFLNNNRRCGLSAVFLGQGEGRWEKKNEGALLFHTINEMSRVLSVSLVFLKGMKDPTFLLWIEHMAGILWGLPSMNPVNTLLHKLQSALYSRLRHLISFLDIWRSHVLQTLAKLWKNCTWSL